MVHRNVKMIRMPNQDTPTTDEIINSSDTEIASKPEDSLPFRSAASLPSPTHARHHDRLFSKMRANFWDGLSSESSSHLTDLKTIHSRNDPVPSHFTPESADKMANRPTPSPGDNLAGEATDSYYDDYPDPYNSFDEFGPFVELGRNSTVSRHRDHWVDPPVSYVPGCWPTGPRELPPDHYVCPYEGCEHPVGPNDSDEGYNRETLGLHIQSHAVQPDPDPFFMRDLRRTVHGRLRAVRRALHCNPRDISPDDKIIHYSGDPKGSQSETDELIQDLQELKNWERSTRMLGPYPVRQMGYYDRMRFTSPRLEKGRHETTEAAEAADDADDESVPRQYWNRLRNIRRQVNPFYGIPREEEVEGPSTSYFDIIARMYSTQEEAVDSDSSFGPPRKKARKSRTQMDGS